MARMEPKDFDFERTLGYGAFSKVLAARYMPTGQHYAVKIISMRQILNAPTEEEQRRMVNVAKRESRVLLMCNHPHIVRFYASMKSSDDLFYVTELVTGGELLDHIRKRRGLSLAATRHIAAEVLCAIEYLHNGLKQSYPIVPNAPLKRCCILHRDIKPENIMLTESKHVKLIDFGTCAVCENTDEHPSDEREPSSQTKRANTFCGTTYYMSPELLCDNYTCTSSDYWALGCVIFHMIAGYRPFEAGTPYLLIRKIIDEPVVFPDGFDPVAKDLIAKLLVRDPNERLGSPGSGGAAAVKEHPFFRDIKDWDNLDKVDARPLWIHDAKWVKDADASLCFSCNNEFSFLMRKHHCRSCGRVFCGNCSKNTCFIPESTYTSPERVCDSCFDELRQY